MRGGSCPKCQSAEVYSRIQGNRALFIAVLLSAEVRAYVCTSCAYIECYVADGFSLVEIAGKWERVLPI